MPKLNGKIPKYRKHKKSGQAIVTLSGHDHYLGPFGTDVSHREFDRVVNEWLSRGRTALPSPDGEVGISVNELVLAFMIHAKEYYVKDGEPTSEVSTYTYAFRLLTEWYGLKPATDFGPVALKALRKKMVEDGMSRAGINNYAKRIRHLFKWGAGEDLVPPSVHQALSCVDGLRRGRTKAKESPPVQCVPESEVKKVLPHLPSPVRTMVQLQLFTGMRPGEVVLMRACDIDMSAKLWEYRPESHKTQHHGKDRVIFLGKKSQRVIRPFLRGDANAYLFSPQDAYNEVLARRAANRKTDPKQGNRPGTNRRDNPKSKPRERYDTGAYRQAIQRACDTAGIDRFSPNQLRHTAATMIRKKHGLEAAQVILGHSMADVTQIYAERDQELARRVMKEIG